MQYIFGAHVVAPFEPYVPPVYVMGAPTFTIPAIVNIVQYVVMEKDAPLKEDASINAQLQGVKKALKSL